MGNLFSNSENIKTKCEKIGYKKGKNINKYSSEKSANNYKKKINFQKLIRNINENKIMSTDREFNMYIHKIINYRNINSKECKELYKNILEHIEKNKNKKKEYLSVIESLIEYLIFSNIKITKNSTQYKHSLYIDNILTIYRYQLASTIINENDIGYISKQFKKDVNRNRYYIFTDNHNEIIHINSSLHNSNLSKKKITAENICNLELTIGNNDKIFNSLNNNGSYDYKINNLLPSSLINLPNNIITKSEKLIYKELKSIGVKKNNIPDIMNIIKNKVKTDENLSIQQQKNLYNKLKKIYSNKTDYNKNIKSNKLFTPKKRDKSSRNALQKIIKNVDDARNEYRTQKNLYNKLNLSKDQKNNLRILLLQNFFNYIITIIIKKYYNCSFSSGSNNGYIIYMTKPNELIIYMCINKCGIESFLPNNTSNLEKYQKGFDNYEKSFHKKNYVINVNLSNGNMTILQHDILNK